MPLLTSFYDQPTGTVTYLVSDPEKKVAALIDPVLDYDPNGGRVGTASADKILDQIAEQGLTLEWVLETHAHADHLSAAHHIREKTGAKIGIGGRIVEVQAVFKPIFDADDVSTDGAEFDHLFEDGETFNLGTEQVKVLHTPGHTPACVSYLIGDAAFVGDTIFMPDAGSARTDFPGGDAPTLFASVHKILALPGETKIFVGHDYGAGGKREPAWETTVAEQKAKNIHVHDGVDEAAYVKMRTERDATLAVPRLILPSLQVNIRAGAMPPPEKDGNVYLKIPVNRI